MAQYYSLPEVAEKFNSCVATIRRMIKRRDITAVKFGGVWMIEEEALEEYVKSRTLKAKRKPVTA